MQDDHQNDAIVVSSTSRRSATVDTVIPLRETATTRLVFAPEIVENPHDPNASVRGHLCWERKGPKDDWEPWTEQKLNGLKKGEGIRIELRAKATKTLFEALANLYDLYASNGIQFGTNTFVQLDGALQSIAALDPSDRTALAELDTRLGTQALRRLLEWLSTTPPIDEAVKNLESIGLENIRQLGYGAGLAHMRAAVEEWRENRGNSSESFWQNFLVRNQFVLDSLFRYPIALIKERAYVGGQRFDGKGSNYVDYLLRNNLTQNSAILEIKPPTTRLLGSEYRPGLYNISTELSGAVMQVLDYRSSFTQEAMALRSKGLDALVEDPPCLVLVGDSSQLEDEDMAKAFSLFRRQVKGVEVVTYDELFSRLENLLRFLMAEVEEDS